MLVVERLGWDFYRNPSHPTTDGIVPAAWFLKALATFPALDARKALAGAQQVAHGAALAMNGKEPSVRKLTDDLRREALPLIHDPIDDPTEDEAPADG